MKRSAPYILSAYSFISTESVSDILSVGYKVESGIPIPSFDENLLIDLCAEAQQIFSKENNLLHINSDVIVVGDIHGSFHDLLRILNFASKSESKVLFLGDIVDRGEFSLECITILFALKTVYPDRYYIVRGNHEFDSLCSKYGFKNEILCMKKSQSLILHHENTEDLDNDQIFDGYLEYHNFPYCYKYTEKLYNTFIRVFSYLPIAALVNKTTFCIHGGLSPKLSHVSDIDELIQRPINSFECNQLLSDLLWSDPSPKIIALYDQNPRGQGFLFNNESIANFLRNNSLTRIIRAHQCVSKGYQVINGGKCLTIFSSSSYDKLTNNSSSILQLFHNDDSFKIVVFKPIKRLHKYEASFYKVQSLYLGEKKIHSCFSLVHPTLRASGSVRIFTNPKFHQKSDNIMKCCLPNKHSICTNSKFITRKKKSQFNHLFFTDENKDIREKLSDDDEDFQLDKFI